VSYVLHSCIKIFLPKYIPYEHYTTNDYMLGSYFPDQAASNRVNPLPYSIWSAVHDIAGGPAGHPCEDDINESKESFGGRLHSYHALYSLICKNKAKSVVTVKHNIPSTVGSTSFSVKNEILHLIAGFDNIQHILTNQSFTSHTVKKAVELLYVPSRNTSLT
jgi:hypothetical protein